MAYTVSYSLWVSVHRLYRLFGCGRGSSFPNNRLTGNWHIAASTEAAQAPHQLLSMAAPEGTKYHIGDLNGGPGLLFGLGGCS